MATYADRIIFLDTSGKQTLAHSSDTIQITSSLTLNGQLTISSGVTSNIISKTANYTVQITDYIISIGTLTTSITITLPASPNNGSTFVISDGAGTANLHSVIVDGNGHNIAGNSTYTMDIKFESITIVYDGTNNIWIVI